MLWFWLCFCQCGAFDILLSSPYSLSTWQWIWSKWCQRSRQPAYSSTTPSSLRAQMGERLILSTLTTSRWSDLSAAFEEFVTGFVFDGSGGSDWGWFCSGGGAKVDLSKSWSYVKWWLNILFEDEEWRQSWHWKMKLKRKVCIRN